MHFRAGNWRLTGRCRSWYGNAPQCDAPRVQELETAGVCGPHHRGQPRSPRLRTHPDKPRMLSVEEGSARCARRSERAADKRLVSSGARGAAITVSTIAVERQGLCCGRCRCDVLYRSQNAPPRSRPSRARSSCRRARRWQVAGGGELDDDAISATKAFESRPGDICRSWQRCAPCTIS